jgi:malate dehydrogenase
MKVAIIGAGCVGATCAQRILEADLADVVLVDIIKAKAQARALDLSSASSIVRHTRSIIGTGDYKDILGANIVVVTAGNTRKPGQNRQDLLKENSQIIKDISQKLIKYCTGSIIIMVTNPVDVMTYLVYKTTGFASTQILGMGGTSDCARFNMLVAKELNTASQYVQSIVIGAHSDNMVILPRLSTALGIPLAELLPEDRIEKIIAESRNFGTRIVKLLGTGSAYYGPSAGVYLLVDAIINDRKSILCASAYLSGEYNLKGLCIGVPIKIGRAGIEEIVELKLSEKEKKAFFASAEQIKDLIKELGV